MSEESQTRSEYVRAVKEFLSQRWTGSKECPICNTFGWTVGDLVDNRTFMGTNPWTQLDGGRVTPTALVFCATCGYQIAFNALLANIPTLPIEDDGGAGEPNV